MLRTLIGLLLFATSYAVSAANIEKLAKGKWLHLATRDFEIITDLNEKKARILMNDLEAYHFFLTEMMGTKLQPNLDPLPILALGSSSSSPRNAISAPTRATMRWCMCSSAKMHAAG